MKKRMALRWTSVIMLVGILGMAYQPAYGGLLAYDQFADYTNGPLKGQGQGFGWGANTWNGATGDYEATVTNTGNLSYGSLSTAGGGATGGANGAADNLWVNRDLGTPITAPGTYYFGFLLQQTGIADAKHNYIRLQAGGGSWAGAGSWNSSTEWQLIRNNGGGYGTVSTGDSEDNDLTYFVIKLAFNASSDEIAYLYVDPADAAALAGSADASYTFSTQWDTISTIQASLVGQSGDVGTMAFDEIRLGTEAADMFSIIPEPSTFALAAFGLLGLARRKRA